MKDYRAWIEAFLLCRHKRSGIVPLIYNKAQVWYQDQVRKHQKRGRNKFLVLKSRREGVTTLEQALSYAEICLNPYRHVVTLAQDTESTEKIFEIANMFYERGIREARPKIKPGRRASKRTLALQNGSLFYIGTAGSETFGRGQTLQRVHGSEVAFWGQRVNTDNLIAGLTEAASEGQMILESTANGTQGWYYEEWQEAERGNSEFVPIFLPWYIGDQCHTPFYCREEKHEFLKSLSDEEKTAQARYKLTPEQLKWRRRKKVALRKLWCQEYPETASQAFIASGTCFFDRETLEELYSYCTPSARSLEGGAITVWREPEPGREYIIGADCAEGLEDGDFSAASIIDRESCEQVAELHGRWKAREFADRLSRWGHYYGKAYMAVEKQNTGHTVLDILINEKQYPRKKMHYHVTYDNKSRKRSKRVGWTTTSETRSPMLNELEKCIAEGTIKVNSPKFLAEAQKFDLSLVGRYEAESGYHDDLVIANAIAVKVRNLATRKAPGVY